jgi:hypothetical protein
MNPQSNQRPKMILLNTIVEINGLTIKERYGKAFRLIRRLQPRDSISCRFTVYRGNIKLEEFRRLASAKRFCREAVQS